MAEVNIGKELKEIKDLLKRSNKRAYGTGLFTAGVANYGIGLAKLSLSLEYLKSTEFVMLVIGAVLMISGAYFVEKSKR
jgi:hypothetical protein